MRQIDVERTGEIDYKTFAQWFGTTKQAEKAERAEAARVRSEMVIDRWASLYEQVCYADQPRSTHGIFTPLEEDRPAICVGQSALKSPRRSC